MTSASSWATRLAAARSEAAGASAKDVEVETAWTWAARAVARAEAAERSGGTSCDAWREYEDALHEALEHAALVRDGGRTLRAVERAVSRASAAGVKVSARALYASAKGLARKAGSFTDDVSARELRDLQQMATSFTGEVADAGRRLATPRRARRRTGSQK